MTKGDPLLETIYARAQEQERKRAVKQAKFEKDIREGRRDADGTCIDNNHPRCDSVHNGVQCAYPAGHTWQHGSGPYLRWN